MNTVSRPARELPMRPLWLLGEDIARSPSPAMHNAALMALGFEPLYRLCPCDAGALDDALARAAAACRGINVTAPHKVEVARRFAGALDARARAVGAVNTVVFERGEPKVALNTDVEGVLVAWRRSAIDVRGRVVGIVGSGGAARAVVVAAGEAGARRLVLHARRPEASATLADLAASVGVEAVAADRPLDATIAVLACSALDDPAVWLRRALAAPGFVHDLRYGSRARATRDAALAAGHLFADGTSMLLGQGRAALAAFLGGPVPEGATSAMARALAAAVSG